MSYKRILTIQDISCVGQCSTTVALPILSACGHETVILPSAILSSHSGGFKGYTFRDLTDDIPAILDHWKQENIRFDAIYSGYLGSKKQLEYVSNIYNTVKNDGIPVICDPVMGDNGKLYSNFDMEYAHSMVQLCTKADIVLPNITEASFMTGIEFKEHYTQDYILNLCQKLSKLGMKTIILTGVSYEEGKTGVAIYEGGNYQYFCHKKVGGGCPGTGDIFASSFTGAYMRGHSLLEAAQIAGEYVVKCIELTRQDPDHWYGAKFEPLLGELISAL